MWPSQLVVDRIIRQKKKSNFFLPTSFSFLLLALSLWGDMHGEAKKEWLFPLAECHPSGHPRQLSTVLLGGHMAAGVFPTEG